MPSLLLLLLLQLCSSKVDWGYGPSLNLTLMGTNVTKQLEGDNVCTRQEKSVVSLLLTWF